MRPPDQGARVTHLPTGFVAMSRVYRNPYACLRAATAMLRAMVARRIEDPSYVPPSGDGPVIRSYDLFPPKVFRFRGPVVRDHRSGAVIEVDARDLFDGGATLDRLMVVRRREH